MTAAEDILVLANASVDSDHLAEAVRVLRTRAQVEVVVTSSSPECRDSLVRLGERLLVIAGGDGTLNNTINELRIHDLLDRTTVALLPMGTGNDFARSLELPLDAAAAAQIALHGQPRTVDLIIDETDHTDGTVVVNVVHAGVGADAAHMSADLKEKVGAIAYPMGAAAAGVTAEPVPVRVHIDAETVFDGDALMVGIGNGRTIGGGTPLLPHARMDDGQLDVVIAAATSATEKVGFVSSLRSGKHPGRDSVQYFTGRSVRIDGAAMRYDADGEISDERTDATFVVQPAVWRIMSPQTRRP